MHYAFFSGLCWILQAFFDKEMLKSISAYGLVLYKSIAFSILITLSFIILKIINPGFITKITKEIRKVKHNKTILKKIIFTSLIGLCSMYVHYLGYTKFKISKFVTLETIFSIIISIFIGYYFFNEKLKTNEVLGIITAVASIIIFYYEDLQ